MVGRDDALALAREIANSGMSVRDIEGRVSSQLGKTGTAKAPSPKSADTIALELYVSNAIGLKVDIKLKGNEESGRGTLSITFKNLDQLDDVLRSLNQQLPRDRDDGSNEKATPKRATFSFNS